MKHTKTKRVKPAQVILKSTIVKTITPSQASKSSLTGPIYRHFFEVTERKSDQKIMVRLELYNALGQVIPCMAGQALESGREAIFNLPPVASKKPQNRWLYVDVAEIATGFGYHTLRLMVGKSDNQIDLISSKHEDLTALILPAQEEVAE